MNSSGFIIMIILIKQDFTAAAANQKWVGDIPGVWTEEGWLYLAALVDIYSRKVEGCAMSGVQDERLVEVALWMALIDTPSIGAESGLLHNTDHGSQYTSRSDQGVLVH